MKILEITEFSAGICGVWTRVLSESREFVKLGYDVAVFSSDIEKGTNKRVGCEDEAFGVRIKRFEGRQAVITKNVTSFDFETEFMAEKPDIVITHLIHPHSFKALKICLKNKIPCYLVTHAPFNVKRRFPLNIATSLYYDIKVKPFLNKFTKVISITKWEMPYLLHLGASKEKIVYIPNGLPEEFFKFKKTKPRKGKDVLFLGRIAPVKNLEMLIIAAIILPKVNFSIVGSAEQSYLEKIESMINKNNLKNVSILSPIYDLKEKIRLIDEHKIFVLPSRREAMPQVLLEAMSRGKIVISSDTDGGKELINKRNGFLFKIGDYKELAGIIKSNLKGNKKIENNAINTAKSYAWSEIIKKYISIFKK